VSATTTMPALARELAGIVGEPHVSEDRTLLEKLAIEGVAAKAVVQPGSPQEVAAVLRLAHANVLVVVPAGGFTQQHTGAPPERVDIILQTSRLTAVEHYDAGDLTIGVGAGTTVAQVEQMVAAHRQIFPLDVACRGQSTIGGALATAAHGALKHGYGGVRDFCIGVRFVTADGRVAKGGGRVVKNVAGYDLMKLLIGSYGTLGVIVGASFKLFPRPSQTRTWVCAFAGLAEALEFRGRLLRSPLSPMCLELVSPHAQVLLSGSDAGAEAWRVYVRAGGSDAVLARYRRELGSAVTGEIEGETEVQFWGRLADFAPAVFERYQNAVLLSVSVPLQAVAEAIAAAEQAGVDNNFVCAAIGRIGVGSLLMALLPVAVDPPAVIQYANAVSALRSALPRDASAVVLRCPREAKAHFSVWGSAPTDLDSMRAVKRAMDEKDILNRGRFLF
jgi:glycolate oxidase FAD binding subunit